MLHRPKRLAAHRAPLIAVGPTSDVAWQLIGQGGGISEFGTHIGLSKDNSGIVYLYIKGASSKALELSNGLYYSTFIEIEAVDCAKDLFSVMMIDYYNSDNTFVYSAKIQNPAFSPVQPRTIGDDDKNFACASSPSGSSSSSAQTSDQFYSGTAWLGPKGYLVTADHVVEGANFIGIFQNGKLIGSADVATADPANDIAILTPKFAKAQPNSSISLSAEPVQLGEHIFTLGYPAPDKMGLSLKMTEGVISSLSGGDAASGRTDDPRLLQLSAPIQSGSSGGPVMDDHGSVVAIVISRLQRTSDDEIAQNVNYGLKIGYVRALFDGLPDLGGHTIANAADSEAAAIATTEGSVFLIVASKSAPQ